MRRLEFVFLLGFLIVVSLVKVHAQPAGFDNHNVIGRVQVPHGDNISDPDSRIPSCADGRESEMQNEAKVLATAYISKQYPALKSFAPLGGQLAGKVVGQLQNELHQTGGTLGDLVDQLTDSKRFASCGTVTLLPP